MQDRRSEAAKKAWATRRSSRYRAGKTERDSKIKLNEWCSTNGWKVVFFEGETGAPRTGIVDAIMVRIKPGDADAVEIKLVQLKAGAGGLTSMEITRLKRATEKVTKDWLLAAWDGESLHILPELPGKRAKSVGA